MPNPERPAFAGRDVLAVEFRPDRVLPYRWRALTPIYSQHPAVSRPSASEFNRRPPIGPNLTRDPERHSERGTGRLRATLPIGRRPQRVNEAAPAGAGRAVAAPHDEESRCAQPYALHAEGIKAPVDLTASRIELAAFDHPNQRSGRDRSSRSPRIHRSPNHRFPARGRCAVIHLGRNTASPAK